MAEDKIWWTEAQIALVEQARDAVQLALRRVQDSEGRNTAVEDRIEAIEQAIIARQAAIEAVIGANVPEHEWDGTLFRLRNPDGSWGAWVDLLSPLATIRNTVLAARDTVVSVGAQVTVDAAAAVTAAGQAAADRAIVTADKATVAADKATVAADRATVAADKAIVAADKATVAADKAIVALDKNAAAASAVAAAASAAAMDPVAKSGLTPLIDFDFTAPEGLLYDSFARGGTIGTYEDACGLIVSSSGLRIEHRSGAASGALIEEASSNAIDQSENLSVPAGWSSGMVWDGAKANPTGNLGCYYPQIGECIKTLDGLNATSVALSFFASPRTGSEVSASVEAWQQVTPTIVGLGTYPFKFAGANPDAGAFRNITRTAFPNNWFRFTAQLVASGGGSGVFTSSARIDMEGVAGNQPYFWGLQVEPGRIAPSSYIPTAGSVGTRAGDIVQLTGSDFLAVSTRTGTIFVEGMFRPPLNTATTNQCVFALTDGTANNRVICYRQRSDNALLLFVNLGGVNVMSLNLGAIADWTTFRLALRFADNLLEASLNGGATQSTSGGNVPAFFTQLRLGANQVGNAQFTGTLRRFALSRTFQTVSAAKLQEMSAL